MDAVWILTTPGKSHLEPTILGGAYWSTEESGRAWLEDARRRYPAGWAHVELVALEQHWSEAFAPSTKAAEL